MKIYRKTIIGTLLYIILMSFMKTKYLSILLTCCLFLYYIYLVLLKLRNINKPTCVSYIYKIYTLFVGIFLASFILIESFLLVDISFFKDTLSTEPLPYVVVLGSQLQDGKVGPTLKTRLDKTVEYYKLFNKTKIIVTGGKVSDKSLSESQAMQDYLISRGIPKESIIQEPYATSTLENIVFTKELLNNTLNYHGKVIIITNEFHLSRAQLIGNILGLESEGLASTSSISTLVDGLIREYPAIIIDSFRTPQFK